MAVASAVRAAAALVAAGLGIALLSPAGTTLARWHQGTALADTDISTGGFHLTTGELAAVRLQSRFSAEERAFTTGTACQPAPGYSACRDLGGGDVAGQLLVPGDRIELSHTFTALASGDHLEGTVLINGKPAASQLPVGSTVSATVRRGGAPVANPSRISGTDSEDTKKAVWTARVAVATPPMWPSDFQRSKLALGALTISVEQVH